MPIKCHCSDIYITSNNNHSLVNNIQFGHLRKISIMIKLGKQLLLQNGSLLRRLTTNPSRAGLVNRKYSNSSYEGDGKTNVKVLNNDMEMGLMVNSFSAVSLKSSV